MDTRAASGEETARDWGDLMTAVPLGARLGAGLPGHGDDAELLEHAQLVNRALLFHELPACHAPDVNLTPGGLLPRRGNALQLALLRAMGSQAVHDCVAFGDFILNGIVEVGKRRQEEANELFEPCTGWWHTRGNHMVNIVPACVAWVTTQEGKRFGPPHVPHWRA
jgi:hypothetical protein